MERAMYETCHRDRWDEGVPEEDGKGCRWEAGMRGIGEGGRIFAVPFAPVSFVFVIGVSCHQPGEFQVHRRQTSRRTVCEVMWPGACPGPSRLPPL